MACGMENWNCVGWMNVSGALPPGSGFIFGSLNALPTVAPCATSLPVTCCVP